MDTQTSGGRRGWPQGYYTNLGWTPRLWWVEADLRATAQIVASTDLRIWCKKEEEEERRSYPTRRFTSKKLPPPSVSLTIVPNHGWIMYKVSIMYMIDYPLYPDSSPPSPTSARPHQPWSMIDHSLPVPPSEWLVHQLSPRWFGYFPSFDLIKPLVCLLESTLAG
jgi:hypothetical protein